MAKEKMTVTKWLKDVYYDDYGTHIWNRESPDGGSQLVADVRGWGGIQNEFKSLQEAEAFQDQVGVFIVNAIREKIEREKEVTND
jgi:hypothetical protein